MKTYLWQEEGDAVDRAISEFTAGEDVVLDRQLFLFDIRATAAHVRGLQRIGVISEDECKSLCDGLEQLETDFRDGDFVLDERFEDGHSAIEIYLTEKTGSAGARVHTGRSRNDQVSAATRLYLKDRLNGLAAVCGGIAEACLQRAESEPDLPMPGYTHLQRAVPSSSGLWMAAFAEAFTDNLSLAISTASLVDSSPLGTAAGYGVNLPLDREGVAQELGFGRLQINPMYAQNSRGKFELMALQAAWHAMQDVRRLAWDLSLFTTAEFAFIRLPKQYITGSSIMPNKYNPDVVELLRGRAATPAAAISEIQSILSLPSGYQRDLQLTKAPLIRGMEASLQALSIVPRLIDGMEYMADAMRDAISTDMYATDIALEQSAAGVPFREAYLDAKRRLDQIEAPDPEASLAQRVSPGACADLRLGEIRQRLVQLKASADVT